MCLENIQKFSEPVRQEHETNKWDNLKFFINCVLVDSPHRQTNPNNRNLNTKSKGRRNGITQRIRGAGTQLDPGETHEVNLG